MKILHTADWHLGQQLCDKDRLEEHEHFLKFLIRTVQEKEIDLLIHAGDVFHSPNPPNAALQQYFNFLKDMVKTCCRQVVIIGGNHDSVSTLNAPKDLLKEFNIRVIGGATEKIEDEIILFPGDDTEPEAVICAVPFLRDKNIRSTIAGERYEEREQRIKEGINRHYNTISEKVLSFKKRKIPIIATGHLFAAGGVPSDSEKDIHIGNLGRISAGQFSEMFDYMALGHLHRPQKVGGVDHVRYSGSPIPLSFSEIKDPKQLLAVEFQGNSIKSIDAIEVPVFRRLLRFRGDFQSVRRQIQNFNNNGFSSNAWVEVQLQLESYSPEADQKIRLLAEDMELDILKVTAEYTFDAQTLDQQTELLDLDEMTPKDVFQKKCQGMQLTETEQQELTKTFEELLEMMDEENSQ